VYRGGRGKLTRAVRYLYRDASRRALGCPGEEACKFRRMSPEACEGCLSAIDDCEINEDEVIDYLEYAQHLLQVIDMTIHGAGITPPRTDRIFLPVVRREVSRIEREVELKRSKMKKEK